MIIVYIICFMAAYVMGSISSAIIVCRVCGLPDPREEGSGNPGATNVLRLGGKKLAAMVFIGDALKGLIPVLLIQLMFDIPWVTMTAALSAFLGHLYPIFFDFKGGKGVATYIGSLIGASYWLGALAGVIWLVVAGVTRISSLSALVMAAVIPFVVLLWKGFIVSIPLFIMSFLLFYRHRANILRLLRGEESKIGK